MLKQFGGAKIENLIQLFNGTEASGDEDSFVIKSKSFSKSLDSAQKKIEAYHYSQRNSLNKYDKILNVQRMFFYKFRYQVLTTLDCKFLMLEFGESFIHEVVKQFTKTKNKEVLNKKFFSLLRRMNFFFEEPCPKKLKEQLLLQFWSIYEKKELDFSCFDMNLFSHHQKGLFLKYIDFYWSKHLENMTFLKETVSWQAYAQKDPFLKYEKESIVLLQLAMRNCRDSVILDFLGSDLS